MYCTGYIFYIYHVYDIIWYDIYDIYLYMLFNIYWYIVHILYRHIIYIYTYIYIYICMYVIYIYIYVIYRKREWERERERKRERKVDDEENSVFLYLSTISFWCLFKCSSMSFQILKRHQKLVLFKRRVPFIIYFSHSFRHVKFRLYVCECIF